MRASRVFIVVAAVLAVSVVSWAGPVLSPSVLGPTGAILTPNTEVNEDNSLDVGVHTAFVEEMWGYTVPGDLTVTSAKVNIVPVKGLELTPTYVHTSWDGLEPFGSKADGSYSYNDDEWTISAKYQIAKEPENKIGMAIGALDLAGELYSNIPYYVVFSKTCDSIVEGRDWRFNAGAMFGTDDVFMTGEYFYFVGGSQKGGRSDRSEPEESRFFASLEAGVADWCVLLAEVADDDFSYGARFVPWDRWRIDVLAVSLANETQLGIGAAYHINF